MGSPKKRIRYTFDAVGNRSGMIDPDGGRFTYIYDAVNRITQVINPQGDRTTYGYDPGGRRTLKTLANGTRASFSYDSASNLTRLANLKSDSTTISSFNYDYDRVGNRTAVLEADSSRVTWSYDDTYQLTGEHRTGTTPHEDSYSYDAAGNRLLKIHDGARTSYSYDAANQLEWSEDASGRTTYSFDADGNQHLVVEPSGDRTTTSWDYENRTTLVQLPSGIRNTMAYEPGGLRVALEESTGTKKFVWDEQNYLAETDENDDTQVVYTNEPRVYGNLVSQRRGADSHWYHFDAIGSTRELTDLGEIVTDTRLYDAWGGILLSAGATDLSFLFIGTQGYFFYQDTVDYCVRRRSYRPQIGRWLSVDPVFGISQARTYAYTENNPILLVDPSGLVVIPPPSDTPCPPEAPCFEEGPTCRLLRIRLFILPGGFGRKKCRGFSFTLPGRDGIFCYECAGHCGRTCAPPWPDLGPAPDPVPDLDIHECRMVFAVVVVPQYVNTNDHREHKPIIMKVACTCVDPSFSLFEQIPNPEELDWFEDDWDHPRDCCAHELCRAQIYPFCEREEQLQEEQERYRRREESTREE